MFLQEGLITDCVSYFLNSALSISREVFSFYCCAYNTLWKCEGNHIDTKSKIKLLIVLLYARFSCLTLKGMSELSFHCQLSPWYFWKKPFVFLTWKAPGTVYSYLACIFYFYKCNIEVLWNHSIIIEKTVQANYKWLNCPSQSCNLCSVILKLMKIINEDFFHFMKIEQVFNPNKKFLELWIYRFSLLYR